ncbi:hypothetical protein POV27_06815 [Aureisphaera galaxeae]|uniref:hypothetical protein n=1 Tax=Aureisphaera galaxeae TaxID=1538023 RepID=UPI00234FC622|nr:hypothetical protein [Aureisphaera galaxeae]MDC8003755.1 hypothetical protein [Aureisphaera galaxeae]
MKIRTFSLLLFLIIFLCSQKASSDYVKPDNVIKSSMSENWLQDAVSTGIEAGVKTVTKEILTNVGKALLASYSPIISDLLFGGDSELEVATERIIDEVQRSHSDISERLRNLNDELLDQFQAEEFAEFETAAVFIDEWLHLELVEKMQTENINLLGDSWRSIEKTSNKIRLYIDTEADARRQFRRLSELIPLHITASQLAATVGQYYHNMITLKTAFTESEFGGNFNRFANWVESLTPDGIQNIQDSDLRYIRYRNEVYQEVIDFYNSLSTRGYVREYLDDICTPMVSHMVSYQGSTSFYDNSAIINDRSNWSVDGTSTAYAILDGTRFYYYINIPEASCLDGYAYDNLIAPTYVPWAEDVENKAFSDCNRFWVVDLDLNSSGWPNTYLSSFDGYSVWFRDTDQLLELHKEILLGDLLIPIYGPVSLIMDRMYEEMHDGLKRPRNNWDNIFSAYDEKTTLLGITDSYTDGISYDDLLEAQQYLKALGANASTVGIGQWFSMIKRYIENEENTIKTLEAIRDLRNELDWMYSSKPELTPSDLIWSLLGDESVFNRYRELTKEELMRQLTPIISCDSSAKFVSIL